MTSGCLHLLELDRFSLDSSCGCLHPLNRARVLQYAYNKVTGNGTKFKNYTLHRFITRREQLKQKKTK